MNLYVNEIFYSIQGETTKAGFPSLFIRLAGCNLECSYCDTKYAGSMSSGKEMPIDHIIKEAASYQYFNHVTITGGEPLLQQNSIHLMSELLKIGYTVQLETNGSISLENVPNRVRKIVDIKTPSSGEDSSFIIDNLKYILDTDELKFVILDINDYKYSVEFIRNYLQNREMIINLSPVYEKLSGAELAELILIDKLPVRLNLQLHKILWPEGELKII